MVKPKCLDPLEKVNEASLDNPYCCAGCGMRFQLRHGVIIEWYYTHNDEQRFGWVPFHSTECLLLTIPATGRC